MLVSENFNLIFISIFDLILLVSISSCFVSISSCFFRFHLVFYYPVTRAQLRLVEKFRGNFSIKIPRNKKLDALILMRPKRVVGRRSTVSWSKKTEKTRRKSTPFTLTGRRRKSMCATTRSATSIPAELVDAIDEAEPHFEPQEPRRLTKPIPELLSIADHRASEFKNAELVQQRRQASQPVKFSTAEFIRQCLMSYELMEKASINPSTLGNGFDRQSANFGKLHYDSE